MELQCGCSGKIPKGLAVIPVGNNFNKELTFGSPVSITEPKRKVRRSLGVFRCKRRAVSEGHKNYFKDMSLIHSQPTYLVIHIL